VELDRKRDRISFIVDLMDFLLKSLKPTLKIARKIKEKIRYLTIRSSPSDFWAIRVPG
jgi:hypothetical protein